MGSQRDLDQGGTFRQYHRVWMGPSVGFLNMPFTSILNITVGGAVTLERWTTLVKLYPNANVTIQLPSAKAAPQGPQAIPGQWVIGPVTFADRGGFASSVNYTILPAAGETISSLASVKLDSAYGTLILEPVLETGGWNMLQ